MKEIITILIGLLGIPLIFVFHCSKRWILKELAAMNGKASPAYIFLKNFIVSDLTFRSLS